MKEIRKIADCEIDRLLEENKSDDFYYDRNKVIVDGLLMYRESKIDETKITTKSTAQSLIKKEAEFDYNYVEEIYSILEERGLDHVKYARPARGSRKDISTYHYMIDLYSAYPHVLAYEKLPVAGELYEDYDPEHMNFFIYHGDILRNECIVTDDLRDYVIDNDLGTCEFLFGTDYRIGSKMGQKMIDMAYKNKKTKQDLKNIHYGYWQKKYIKYNREEDCYVRYPQYKYEIIMIAILSQLVYTMLSIRDIIGFDDYSHFVVDAYYFDDVDDIDRIVSEIKNKFPNYDYRIIDIQIPSEEDRHGTILYKSYPDLPDAPRSHHKKCTKVEQ